MSRTMTPFSELPVLIWLIDHIYIKWSNSENDVIALDIFSYNFLLYTIFERFFCH